MYAVINVPAHYGDGLDGRTHCFREDVGSAGATDGILLAHECPHFACVSFLNSDDVKLVIASKCAKMCCCE